MKVLDFPLTKITIWFLFGILFSYYGQLSLYFIATALSVGFVALLIFYLYSGHNKRLIIFFGLSTYVFAFFLGSLTLMFHTDSLERSNYIHYKKAFETPHNITFTLREKLKSNSYNDRYTALINTIDNQARTGKVIVNIQKDSLKNSICIGSIIKAKTILKRNPSNKNPNQFDYGKYLSNKQIYAQIYVNKSEIYLNKNLKKDIWYYSGRLHSHIVRNLEKAHFDKAEMNVALALILGQQQEISSDIIQDYQFSGATHVLSVSGLHVGFIILFINFILKPIPNTRKGSFIKLFSILISLLVFAVISGLSPSVLRSVVMFSFVAIGGHLRRTGNIYHTLLVSMFLILLFEPYFLFDVGFQLSYLALFFIIWLQPILQKIWSPKNKFSIHLWNALTVSFAAQIGTLPLCLYYFHQFPGLFFVTNIVIIPLLSFIMIAGIIVMIWAVFHVPPFLLIEIFQKSISLLNFVIHYVASFEWFVIRNISFNSYYLFTLYLVIISAAIWFKKSSYTKLIMMLLSIISFQVSLLYTKRQTQLQHEIVIYNSKENTVISERIGTNISIYTNDTLAVKKSTIVNSYIVGNFGQLASTSKIRNMLFFKQQKIFVMDSSGIYETRVQPDILLLTQSPKINLERLLQDLHPKIIIADASNSYSIQKLWSATCLKKGIPFHSTSESGFYRL